MAKDKDLREMSGEELERALADAKEQLFTLRFQLVTGQLDNPMRIKAMRKRAARIMTVQRERELALLEQEA